MTITEFNLKLGRLIGDLQQPIGKPPEAIMLKLANDTITMIRTRLIQTGKTSKGTKFSPYAKGYKEYKRSLGHPVEFKNFFLNGTMLNDMRPFKVRKTGQTISVQIGFPHAAERAKMMKNTVKEERRGYPPIMSTSVDERKFLRKTFNDWLTTYFNEIGL